WWRRRWWPRRWSSACPAQPAPGGAAGLVTGTAVTGDAVAVAVAGQLVAVVPQEQLFERGGLADQAADAQAGQVAHRGVELRGVDVEPGAVVFDDEVVHAGQRLEARDGGRRLDGHRGAGEVAQLG